MYVYVHECIIEINEKTPDEGSSWNTLCTGSKIKISFAIRWFSIVQYIYIYIYIYKYIIICVYIE